MTDPPLSRCPHCGARGVQCVEPLIKDGHNCDVPYCGKCGRNYPARKADAVDPSGGEQERLPAREKSSSLFDA
jgi:hypothetical protein